MIKLKAVAHPPDPLVPSLFPAGKHWIGWAGKSLSRQAIQRRLLSDIRLYGPRGVVEINIDLDLPSERELTRRMEVADLESGHSVFNWDRCSREARDWVIEQSGLESDDLPALLMREPTRCLDRLFSAEKLKSVQIILWTALHEDSKTAFGALRDASRVVDVRPHREPPFFLGVQG
ncbi:MAG: hypothetical protein HKL99_14205 [Burkholderiales bacterium]|nr:hypothetical protein [Burkholderiales bacterium]